MGVYFFNKEKVFCKNFTKFDVILKEMQLLPTQARTMIIIWAYCMK